MALQIQGFNEIGGLVTSSNDLNRPANSLRDCSNVVYTEIGTTQARKGHPYQWAPTSTSYGSYLTPWVGIFQHPDLPESKYGVYASTGVGNIFVMDPSAGTLTEALVKAYTSYTSGTENNESDATSGTYSMSTATSYWSVPRSVVAQKNVYFMAANGLFRSVQGSSNNKFKKVVPCSFADFTVATRIADKSRDWFLPGYKVAVRAIIKEQIGETAYLEWSDSGVMEVVNYDLKAILDVSLSFFTTGQKDLEDVTVEIYRTVQYKPNEVPPTDYYLADSFTASEGSKAANTKISIVRTLKLGDDAVRGSGIQLYFGDSSELKNVTPPVAKDLVNYKGYTVYGNVTPPAISDITITSVPKPAEILAIKAPSGDIPVPFRDVYNHYSPNLPSTTGYFTTWSVSDRGTDSYKGLTSAITTYPLVIRPLFSTAIGNICGVTPHLSSSVALTTDKPAAVTTSQIIKVTLDKTFTNLNVFESPGICAVTDNVGSIREIFSYTDFEVIRNIVEFTGAQSITNFSNASGSVYTGPATYYLYFIPGTSISNLPIYPIHKDAITSFTRGFSLLPTKINFQDGDYITSPAGVATNPSISAGSTANSVLNFFGIRSRDAASQLLLSVQQWVRDYNTNRTAVSPTASWLVVDNQIKIRFENILVGENASGTKYNSIELRKQKLADVTYSPSGSNNIVFSATNKTITWNVAPSILPPDWLTPGVVFTTSSGNNPGPFTVTSKSSGNIINVAETVVNETFSAGSSLTFSTNVFDTDPDIVTASSGTYTNVLFDDVQVKNGIIVSKYNRPDAVSYKQVNSPLRIGRDDREIERLVATEDSLYVFKSQEGIYRMDLAEGSENPQVTSVILIDNTTWLVGTESVQEINESIYFLSNKGVIRLSGNSMSVLSDAIDVELRRALTTSIKANTTGSIRSFGNETRKLYGVYIPNVATFVYDISAGMWAKWDFGFDHTLVNADGRLLTTDTIGSWNYIRQDVYTTSLDDAVDQYDGEWALTGATSATVGLDVTFSRNYGSPAKIFDAIGSIADYVGTRKVYFQSAVSGYYAVTLTKTSSTQLKVTFTETPPTISISNDKIICGVNTSITVNKYWVGAASRGAQFNKFNLFVNGVVDDVRVGFEMDNTNPDFSTATFSTFDTESDILTTLVPRCQGNGRWVMFRVEHSYPKQHFQAQGFSYVIRPLRTDRVERD